jgi:hypothetical protein
LNPAVLVASLARFSFSSLSGAGGSRMGFERPLVAQATNSASGHIMTPEQKPTENHNDREDSISHRILSSLPDKHIVPHHDG